MDVVNRVIRTLVYDTVGIQLVTTRDAVRLIPTCIDFLRDDWCFGINQDGVLEIDHCGKADVTAVYAPRATVAVDASAVANYSMRAKAVEHADPKPYKSYADVQRWVMGWDYRDQFKGMEGQHLQATACVEITLPAWLHNGADDQGYRDGHGDLVGTWDLTVTTHDGFKLEGVASQYILGEFGQTPIIKIFWHQFIQVLKSVVPRIEFSLVVQWKHARLDGMPTIAHVLTASEVVYVSVDLSISRAAFLPEVAKRVRGGAFPNGKTPADGGEALTVDSLVDEEAQTIDDSWDVLTVDPPFGARLHPGDLGPP